MNKSLPLAALLTAVALVALGSKDAVAVAAVPAADNTLAPVATPAQQPASQPNPDAPPRRAPIKPVG
jgi:hypothetical protein